MMRIVWLFLLALALSMTAFASSVKFSNSGGTVSGISIGSSMGLTLSGSTLISDGSILGSNLGSVTFTTGALESGGSLQMGGTFMAGGTFTITGDGMNGVHSGVIFTGSFSSPVTWALVTLANGTHNYQMSGTLSGTWFNGASVDGATVELTMNVGKGFFGQSVTLSGGDTNITTSVVPEPGSLTLLGTGLFGLAGAVRRKLKA